MDLVQDTREYLFSEITLVFLNENNVFFFQLFTIFVLI